MDGAWALYEAWIKIQCGTADSALVFAFFPAVRAARLKPVSALRYE